MIISLRKEPTKLKRKAKNSNRYLLQTIIYKGLKVLAIVQTVTV
jgi:hypothetical protein